MPNLCFMSKCNQTQYTFMPGAIMEYKWDKWYMPIHDNKGGSQRGMTSAATQKHESLCYEMWLFYVLYFPQNLLCDNQIDSVVSMFLLKYVNLAI